jgi:hypothetical protein
MAKLLTISDWQSGNLVLKKTGFKENQLAESILFIWFYGNLVLEKTSSRNRFCLSGFTVIWF